MTSAELEAIVDKCLIDLGEHFDCVQILGSFINDEDGGSTSALYRGIGNWYARQGMATEFLQKDEAQTTAWEVARAMNPTPPNDGDEWKDIDQ